jgi:hypothetical protein
MRKTMMLRRGWLAVLAQLLPGIAVLMVAGCASQGRPLMPTPLLYQEEPGQSRLFSSTAPERQRTNVEFFYVTDRGIETDPESKLPYGEVRATSMAFGSASVEMLPGLTWPELTKQSTVSERTRDVLMELGPVKEVGRSPKEPYDLQKTNAGISHTPEVLRKHETAKAEFQKMLVDQIGLIII